MAQARKCLICERRPARVGPYCHDCAKQLDAEKRRRRPARPWGFIVYRSMVVGLYRKNGEDVLTARPLNRDPEKLPKDKTINLDRYVPGYTRQQVKRMQRAVLQAHHA